MHPSNIFSLLAAAAMATAMPGKPYKGGDGSAPATNNVCGQDQKLSCCNSAGLSVLGIECSLSSDLGGNCNGNVQCCDVSQNGQINLVNLCVPIAL